MDEVPDGIEIGDSASFEVILEQKEDVLIVPKRAVIQYMGCLLYTSRHTNRKESFIYIKYG